MRVLQAGAGVVREVSFHPGGGELAVAVSGREVDEPAVVWLGAGSWRESRRLSLFDAVGPNVLWVDTAGEDVPVSDLRAAFPKGPTAFALSPDHAEIVSAWPTTISWKWQQVVFSS